MTGRGWRLFKLVSMLLIATSFYCAFSLTGAAKLRFWIMLGVVSLVGIAFLTLFMQLEKNLHSFVSEMQTQLNLTERDSLYKFPAPALIVDGEGVIIWFNKAFTEQIHPADAFGVALDRIIDIDLKETFAKHDTVVEYNSGHYRVKALTTEKRDENNTVVSGLTLLYFQDISELISVKREYENSKNHVAMILIDSYEELFAKVKDSDKAHITIQIDKLVENFMEAHNGLLKKISSDRYFAVISEEELEKLEKEQFKSIIDQAHQIVVSEHNPVTLSIGIGRGGANLRESEELSRQALNMTQGRGGDQVAIKNETDFVFYGGNSAGIEKNTKVKTRIFSEELLGRIKLSDRVILMGHSWGDLDAVGAAAGLCGAIRAMGYKAHAYSNIEKTLATPIINRLRENLEGEDVFISEAEALAAFDEEKVLLIIVDTNKIALLDSKAIYEKASEVVYIDHHRLDADSIQNEVLSLHEPYASSTCEMVAEVIQYFTLDEELSSYFADAMLAGIMLDTKDFIMKTGARTFEAAAYLKKLGADSIAVKLLFSDSIETSIKRSQFIEASEVYRRCAVSSSTEQFPEARIAAAQAADSMLGITGVDASFVIFSGGGTSFISARSYGAINVHKIMEKLGGGGHQTMAAAQLADTPVEEARKKLIAAIDEFIDTTI